MEKNLVHHLYQDPSDLLPYCGAIPGPDELTGDWHTGHARDELLLCVEYGLVCCTTCLSPRALGGFTPLILEQE